MKLMKIVNATQALGKLSRVDGLNGLQALELQEKIEELAGHVEAFEKVKKAWFERNETQSVKPGTDEYNDLIKHLNEAGEKEIEVEVKPLIKAEEIPDIKPAEARALLDLGIVSRE
jgi:CRISPR/Cas system-associated endonuclease/helicase Cas3